ncbi:hypothetical protein DFH06DRAFT_1314105 [Mycena polygramma]|nr:hypothetical protein DFH06DRAFT_1314105 [Mycena polygramma]
MLDPQGRYSVMHTNTDDVRNLHQNHAPPFVPCPGFKRANGASHCPTHYMGSAGNQDEHPLPFWHSVQPHLAHSFHGNFFSAQNIVNGQHVDNHGESGINILHRAVALEALFDSADSFPQPRCHPQTRARMLDDLYNWAIEGDRARPIRWLHGPAGAGKSAIMQTLCKRLQSTGRLGGAFFFKRDHVTRGNARVLFATLAYQLALNSRHLKNLISQSVEADPSVVGRQMDIQLQKLVVEPCQAAQGSVIHLLLIDGLDECDSHRNQVEILRLVASAVDQHPNKVRFLIASRPEAHLRVTFEDPSLHTILESTNVEQSFKYIRAYLSDEFSRIHREHRATMRGIPTPWPSSEVVDDLFVDDKYFRPTQRLAAVQHFSLVDSDAPFAALDQLYTQILSGVPARFRSRLRDIVVVLCRGLTPSQVDLLFEMQPGDVELILHSLHSVLHVDQKTGFIRAHHASLLDFLDDERRSGTFHPTEENRMTVATTTLKALSDSHQWSEGDPLAWRLDAEDLIWSISALPPSTDLVPLIRQANPRFLWPPRTFFTRSFIRRTLGFINWLKAINPVPEDLIQRWEAYALMFSLENLQRSMIHKSDLTYILSLSTEKLGVLQRKMSRIFPRLTSTDLLYELRGFVPPWNVFRCSNCSDCLHPEEFYHVIQWLKTFPNPPADMCDVLKRWQGHLRQSRKICKSDWSEPDQDAECNQGVGVASGTFDEREMIRRWEYAIEMRQEDSDEEEEEEDEEMEESIRELAVD